jgi:hypothetical protein
MSPIRVHKMFVCLYTYVRYVCVLSFPLDLTSSDVLSIITLYNGNNGNFVHFLITAMYNSYYVQYRPCYPMGYLCIEQRELDDITKT